MAAQPKVAHPASVAVEGLSHWYVRGPEAPPTLDGIGLEIEPGEVVIMTGPSGSGKTTLLTLVGALRSVQEGSLQVLGRELRGLGRRELVRVRRDIGFIFQTHNLFDALTARQNVRMTLELEGERSSAEMDRLAGEMLEQVGLGHRIDHKPAELSTGQRQRVAVARALVHGPRLVLADEPTAALDEEAGRTVVTLLRERASRDGVAVMIVTHDARILDVADRIVNMVDGRIASNIAVANAIQICEFLTNCPVFQRLTPDGLTEVSQRMKREIYGPGDLVIRQGDEGDRFYLVRIGEVAVYVEEAGSVKPLATLGPGEFFGEASLLTGEPRNATVRCLDDVELYSLDKESFQAALESSSTFAEQLGWIFFGRR